MDILDRENSGEVWLTKTDVRILFAWGDDVIQALDRLTKVLDRRGLADEVIDLQFHMDSGDPGVTVGAVLEPA